MELAECNWSCARASICHEFEDCDTEIHFIPLKDILENIEKLDPEFSKVIDENYWNLI